MTTFTSTCAALTALLAAATFTASAEARAANVGGHMGGHMGHIGHVGHIGHDHVGHHHGHAPLVGFGLYAPDYSYYDDDAYCYRVYRDHHWRTVCD